MAYQGGITKPGYTKPFDTVDEKETKGVFGGEGGGKNLKEVGSDGLFSLKDKKYAGPGNLEFAPEDKGDKSFKSK